MKRRTYGYDRVKLYEHYTADELAAWLVELSGDPANANPTPGALDLLNAVTRRRIENITWAIYYHQKDKAKRERGAA